MQLIPICWSEEERLGSLEALLCHEDASALARGYSSFHRLRRQRGADQFLAVARKHLSVGEGRGSPRRFLCAIRRSRLQQPGAAELRVTHRGQAGPDQLGFVVEEKRRFSNGRDVDAGAALGIAHLFGNGAGYGRPAMRICVAISCMKTTIEIADDLFERAQGLARKEKTTFRALAEQGLRLVLKEKRQSKAKKLPPLVTLRGKGLTNEFKSVSWDRIRDEIYKGHGA